MIDKSWRFFLNGTEIIFIKALIQETLESFFEFTRDHNLFEGDPYKIKSFETAIQTRDLQGIQPLYSQNFSFQYKHSRSGRTEEIVTTIVKLQDNLRRAIGGKEYNERLQVGEKLVVTLKNYTSFFVSARNIGFHRNKDSHEKYPIDDTGFALEVAADIMTIIEKTPVMIRNQDALVSVRKNLKKLLEQIVQKENPDQDPFEDSEADGEEKSISQSSLPIETINNIEEKYNSITEKLDSISNIVDDNKLATFTIAELVQELMSSSDSISQIEKIQEGIQDNKKNIQLILEQQQAEIEEEKDLKANTLNPQEEKSLKLMKLADAITSPLNPSKMAKLGMEMVIDRKLKNDQKKANSKVKIADESTRVSSYTPQQAIPEMLAFQKKFKQNFDCENWQNLAQGPFRREILENKIKSKKEFLSNSFIKQRYELHHKVFDEQINSDLGEEFFNILDSVLYTN